MSAGYVVTGVVFMLLSALATGATFHYYTKRSAKTFPRVCMVFLVASMYCCVVPFPLLVLDIDAAITMEDAVNKTHSERWLLPVWIVLMVVTQTLAWGVLPITQNYTEVGPFTPKRKIKRILKNNGRMYIIMGVTLGSLFGYLIIIRGAYKRPGLMLSLAISAANAWGLLLLIIFGSAGLLGVPKMLWKTSDPKSVLRRVYYDATDIQEDLDIAAMDLASVKAELLALDPRVEDAHRPYLSSMLEYIAAADREIPLYHTASSRVKLLEVTQTEDVSLVHLEDLNQRLKYSVKIAVRMNYRWDKALRDAERLDQLVLGTQSTNNQAKKVWFMVRGPVYKLLSLGSLVLSLLILWSELVLPFQSLVDMPLSVIQLAMGSSVHFFASVLFLFYFAYCVYWAIFHFKVFEIFCVLPSVSDNASMCFMTVFLMRLMMPLCLNFLLVCGLQGTVDVYYSHVYRKSMDVTLLLGEWINNYLPVLIPFMAVLIQAKVFDRLLNLIGVDTHDPNDLDSAAVRQKIVDGHRLVTHALGKELYALTASDLFQSAVTPAATPSIRDANTSQQPASRGQRYRDFVAKRNLEEGESSPKGDRLATVV